MLTRLVRKHQLRQPQRWCNTPRRSLCGINICNIDLLDRRSVVTLLFCKTFSFLCVIYIFIQSMFPFYFFPCSVHSVSMQLSSTTKIYPPYLVIQYGQRETAYLSSPDSVSSAVSFITSYSMDLTYEKHDTFTQ